MEHITNPGEIFDTSMITIRYLKPKKQAYLSDSDVVVLRQILGEIVSDMSRFMPNIMFNIKEEKPEIIEAIIRSLFQRIEMQMRKRHIPEVYNGPRPWEMRYLLDNGYLRNPKVKLRGAIGRPKGAKNKKGAWRSKIPYLSLMDASRAREWCVAFGHRVPASVKRALGEPFTELEGRYELWRIENGIELGGAPILSFNAWLASEWPSIQEDLGRLPPTEESPPEVNSATLAVDSPEDPPSPEPSVDSEEDTRRRLLGL